ncbi:MAG: hypothetical protein ABS76_16245 [Pelagibacterium sp. SCN 64-44]|nr:MAG: hypothetical protein ABS76_16245 [Pelagibacterium sp. SCN 64-44]
MHQRREPALEGENVRVRLSDGCIILGREFEREELARLVAGDFPFVAVGRRDDAGGPVPYVGGVPAETLEAILESGATCAFFTELADAIGVEAAARAGRLSVPEDLSIVVLGNHIRAEEHGRRFTSFSIPREAMGRAATEMLVRRVENGAAVEQVLLDCPIVEGDTLGPVSSQNSRIP